MSEKVHSLPRQLAITDGIEVVEAATRLNAACAGKQIISDSPHFDQGWLSRLFHDAGVEQAFSLGDSGRLEVLAAQLAGLVSAEVRELQERVKTHYPHPHRAAPDARRAAALFLALAAPDAIDAIIAAA
jgi:hypothetical protein